MLKVTDARGQIRRLQSEDFEAIASIHNAAIARGECVYHVPELTRSSIQQLLIDVPSRFESFVYETESGVMGWASLLRYNERKAYEPTAEIVVYVHPSQVQKGIGRALVNHALARAPRVGFHTIVLLLQKEPAYLLSWAARLGFRSAGYVAAALPVGTERRDILIFQYSVEVGRESNDQTS